VIMPTDAARTQPHIPSTFELAGLIDQVLSDWAFLSAVPAGKPAAGPADMALEFSVSLSGPFECLLNLRAGYAFAQELAQASTGDPGAREQASDAFKELCNLVASHLLTAFFGGSHLVFEPFVPQLTGPAQWPAESPNVASVMLVNHLPLEARLWVKTSPGASRG
jgi:hypothetical protein